MDVNVETPVESQYNLHQGVDPAYMYQNSQPFSYQQHDSIINNQEGYLMELASLTSPAQPANMFDIENQNTQNQMYIWGENSG